MKRVTRELVSFGDFGHSSRRFFWSAAAVFVVLTLGYEAALASHLGGSRLTTAIDDIGQGVAAGLAAIACAVAALRSRGLTRTGWGLIALSALAWAAGEAAWTYMEVLLRHSVLTPSVADVGYLLATPPGIAGLLVLAVATGRRNERLRSVVDGLLVASALLFLSWETILRTIVEDGRVSQVAKIVSLTYPVADVVMLTIVVVALSHTPRGRMTPMALLGAGIVCLAFSDSGATYLMAPASNNATTPLDVGWFAGYLLIALASLRAMAAESDESGIRMPGLGRAAAPYFAIGLAIVAAVAVVLTEGQLDRIGIRIAAVVAGLSFLSQLLMSRENRELLSRSLANEEALIESQRSLTQVIGSAPVALFSIALDGTLTLATGRALARFGAGADNVAGRKIGEILEEFPEFLECIQAALAGVPGQIRVSFPHGELDVRLLPVLEGSRVVSVSGVAVDVSEQRLAEEARRESDAKSRFVATMSHELRTPLNSVIGFAELLAGERRGALNEYQRRYVANIATSGAHLLQLINEVLDLSRIASGEVQVTLEAMPLDEIISDTVAQLRPLAERKRVRLEAGFPTGLAVWADAIRVRQVILNLLSNAIKFTPSGGLVDLDAFSLGATVEVRVRDTGVGIAAEHLERIFEEYAQVAGAGDGAEGTGLGLAVSRRLAVLMEGTVTVESELGHGSTFTLTLPAASAVAAENASRRMADAGRPGGEIAEVASEAAQA